MRDSKKLFTLFFTIAILMILAGPLRAEETEKININTATVTELVKLKGIGPKYASRIIEYRETHGPFKKPEEIMKVKGIGPKTFEANKDRITVE